MADSDRSDLLALLSEPVLDETSRSALWPVTITLFVIGIGVAGYIAVTGGEPSTTVATSDTLASSESATPDPVPEPRTPVTTDPTPTTGTTPTQYPPELIAGKMEFDPDSETVVMFGGSSGGSWTGGQVLADTWLYSASENRWRMLDATLVPPQRAGHAIAYVDSLGEVVVVGGGSDPVSGCSRFALVRDTEVDMWSLDVASGAWSWLSPTAPPTDRWGHAIAYDPTSDRLVLLGGIGEFVSRNRAELLDDTWVYEASDNVWEAVETESAPEARACHQMVYDPGTELIYLWGGQTESTAGDGTMWSFSASDLVWTEVETFGVATPEPRWLHQMVYEPSTGLVFVIGGAWYQTTITESGTTKAFASSDEVWAFDPQTAEWEPRTPAPAWIGVHAAAPTGDGRIVIFNAGVTLIYDAATDSWEDLTPATAPEPTP